MIKMYRNTFPLLLICCLFITTFSCSNQSGKSRKPVSVITIQPSKKNYSFGEKVSVNVKTKVKNGEIEIIQLYYKNQLLKETKELDFVVEGIELNSIGANNFTVDALKTDGLKNSRSQSVAVISDVVPQKYTYRIVNNYPHSVEHYTQGLEFFDGYFYEGTGENGSSGLFKINIETGKEIKRADLDEKYFGEGITILNDKIYQLTYRAQKGFVYRFSDFGLIDSFRFNSKEGWGLTNDGTNLIMSDGTNLLTWLNPEDFSVVKTVQVANNTGIVNYLNELEFIDETIYANIYTTDLIMQIDPKTGKVLSEINLSGLIDMYKNTTNRIDYLNGIAYDKKNDRLFVTGKLWPRLFEIKLVSSK